MHEVDAKARILSAAEQLFAGRGFDGVSMRDVAEHAGEKKASVFYHFGSKPELFQRVLEGYYAAHARILDEGENVTRPPSERLHALLDRVLDFVEDNHRYVRLVQLEIARGSEMVPQISTGLSLLSAKVADILQQVVPAQGPLSARQFFVTFSGIINTYFVYAPVLAPLWDDEPLEARARRERREHVHWIADALLEKLRAESTPAQQSL